MKFSDLKDAIPFTTILVNTRGHEWLFAGFNPINNKLIIRRTADGIYYERTEAEIEDWYIKQPEAERKKLLAFKIISDGGLILEEEGSQCASRSIKSPRSFTPVQLLIDGKPVELEIREK